VTQAIVRAALESKLATWSAGLSTPLQVAFENTEFTPPAGATYLRCFLLPLPTGSEDLGRAHRRFEGVFQVSIVLPLGVGPGAGDALVTALDAEFAPALSILRSGLRIYLLQPMAAAPGIREPDRWVIPCSVPYRADSY